jgi:serine/threonine protein kinase
MPDTDLQNPGIPGTASPPGKEPTLEEKVLDCFVSLFKKQLGFRRRVGAEISFLEANRFNPKVKTYNARVKVGMNDWRSRRFTVGPIGEETGSKSKCFLVIYDDKIVVKVPPIPITDFDAYVNSMKKERRIVEKVQPRESVIPSLGVILNKYQPYVDDMAAAGNQLTEESCVAWLKENPDFQEYFQIDGGFVFFMDLAKYVFLADAIALFHSVDSGLQEELLRDPTIIDDFDKFEGRYGLENAQLGMDLKSVYDEFEDRLRKLMVKAGVSPSLLLYKTQEWFFRHVAGLEVEKDEKKGLDEGFVRQLNGLLKEIMDENRDLIVEYRQMVQESIQTTTFSQHKVYMEGLIANSLELLAWLEYKGVAIRDIKPDNLLVAGDPDRYPSFLSAPTTFKIGLIDVETAVDIKPEDGRMVQPQLGGTPFYATPLNMFSNKTLLSVYGDLPRALFIQDWFSTMAMIYGIIVNEYLFGRTAKQLVILTRKIQKALKVQQPPDAVLKEANKVFWAGAAEEFANSMRQHQNLLRHIRVFLHDNVRQLFEKEFSKEHKITDKAIKRLIAQQPLFKSQQNQAQLYQGTPDRIDEIIDKVKRKPGIDSRAVAQLQRIRQLKARCLYYEAVIGLAQDPNSELSAYYLLDIMFTLARDFMDLRF